MIKDNSEYLKIHSKIRYFIFLCLYYFLFPIAKIMFGKRNSWILCERGSDAQDNAFVFFQYLVDNHPEIRSSYVIDKNSPDFKKVTAIGRTIKFKSFRHLLMTIGCPVKISSHLYGYSPWTQLTLYYRRHRTIDKHIFLQHGITKNYHSGLCGDNCRSLDLFVCGARPEYEYILNNFDFNNVVPQCTGFPRYDLLNNHNLKNQILIMPTWRSDLVNLSDAEFVNSKYYLLWKEVVENNELISIAKQNNITIKFYLHNSFQKYTHLFNSDTDVEIINYEDETVQTLIKESKLLITDFSSVYFDFAYLSKPIIYYQFDEDDYYSNHYEKGYFDYRRDGFGDVCVDIKGLIDSVRLVVSHGFTVEDKYSRRIQRFFEYRDTNNCKRVFDLISGMINEK